MFKCSCVSLLVLGICLLGLPAEEHPLSVLMGQLPKLKATSPVPSVLPDDLQGIIPGLSIVKQKRIYFDGKVIFDQGPKDGLEAIACMPGGKNHESMLVLDSGNGALIKSLFIAHLHMQDGGVSPQDSGLPARGYPIRVVLRWQPDAVLEPDQWVERDVSTMVRDRVSGQAYPPLPYLYTGSRFLAQVLKDKNGQEQEREIFMLDSTKTLIANYDEADALLASPFALAQFDILFEVNSADAPVASEESHIQLYCEAAPLALYLDMDAAGALSLAGKALDGPALEALLKQHFAADKEPQFRAIGIRVAATTEREVDVRVREQLLRHAVAAQAWVMPLFIPAGG